MRSGSIVKILIGPALLIKNGRALLTRPTLARSPAPARPAPATDRSPSANSTRIPPWCRNSARAGSAVTARGFCMHRMSPMPVAGTRSASANAFAERPSEIDGTAQRSRYLIARGDSLRPRPRTPRRGRGLCQFEIFLVVAILAWGLQADLLSRIAIYETM
jgi:hypothetical protein